jgi:hypothetical protein
LQSTPTQLRLNLVCEGVDKLYYWRQEIPFSTIIILGKLEKGNNDRWTLYI